MGLETHQPVNHVGADFLQRPRPGNICFFIEPRLKLHQHGNFFAGFGGQSQGLRNRRSRADSIKRHLDSQNFRVFRGFFDEAGDGVERMIRMEHQHIAAANRAPDIGRAFERRHRQRRLRLVFQPRQVDRRV